jgi:hypothetical protein
MKRKRNPGKVRAGTFIPDSISFHPGYPRHRGLGAFHARTGPNASSPLNVRTAALCRGRSFGAFGVFGGFSPAF